jgi:release factor glutamine methyltransferase
VATLTIAALLAEACAALDGRVDDPRREAEYLLSELLGVTRASLVARDDEPVPDERAVAFHALVARRRAGEPAAYLVGRRAFWTLDLEVSPDVLVPRPETELLVELALQRIGHLRAPRVLDLGTGSGAIGLAIAAERPDALVTLVDASDGALAVAARNRDRHGLARVELLRGDWYAAVGERRFDAIVSNPPYLGADDPHLATPELRHEPRTALVSGRTGLESLATIAAGACAHLGPGGWLLMEHGADQGAAVRDLYRRADLAEVATARDLAGLERVTCGLRPPR